MEEDLEEFVNRDFPQLTDEENNILSEEAIMQTPEEREDFVNRIFPRFTDEENDILSEEAIMETPEEREDLEDFVKRVFPRFTNEENNILSEEAIMQVLTDSEFPQEEEPMEEEITGLEVKKLDLSDCVITISPQYHPNLVYINLANSYGLENEEEILNLLKMDMVSLENLNISFIRFKNPRYPLKLGFARVFWQHVADYAINQWPKLQTVTGYGYPLHMANALKIGQKIRSLNATVASAKTARIMLKKMPEQTAKCSNLCDKWSDLISATQYTNTGGKAQIPVDDEFVSVLVPSYIDVDVDHIEGEMAAAIKTILTNTPPEVSISIFFPFFVAKSSEKSPQYTPDEVELLIFLCQKAFESGLDKKYAIQIEFFVTELTKGDSHVDAVAPLSLRCRRGPLTAQRGCI